MMCRRSTTTAAGADVLFPPAPVLIRDAVGDFTAFAAPGPGWYEHRVSAPTSSGSFRDGPAHRGSIDATTRVIHSPSRCCFGPSGSGQDHGCWRWPGGELEQPDCGGASRLAVPTNLVSTPNAPSGPAAAGAGTSATCPRTTALLFPHLTVEQNGRLRPLGRFITAAPSPRSARFPRTCSNCWGWVGWNAVTPGQLLRRTSSSASALGGAGGWPAVPDLLLLDEPLSALDGADARANLARRNCGRWAGPALGVPTSAGGRPRPGAKTLGAGRYRGDHGRGAECVQSGPGGRGSSLRPAGLVVARIVGRRETVPFPPAGGGPPETKSLPRS